MNGRLLVAYCNASTFVSTTVEYLESIARYSDFDVRFVHVTHGAELAFDLEEFDAIFHNYCARLPFPDYVSPNYLAKLKAFRGVKVLAVQDEYDHTNRLRRAIRDSGFHVVLTCVPPSMLQAIYPRRMFQQTEFVTVLTGYVPEHLPLQAKSARPLRDRPVGIGYRGRDIGGRYGRLAFEKLEIGRRMREICAARGISHDIEWTEDKRLYGLDWYNFIASCRANLGSESGSNVFDFDGAIAAKYKELESARGGPVPYEEFRIYTDPLEAKYDMGQISPRVLEAAAMRTPMILFTGCYSGVIEPETHYLELRKDFSNIDRVLSRLDDLDVLERMADRAYERLVGSGEFSYRRFVALIDSTIRRKATEIELELRSPRASRRDESYPATTGLQEVPTRTPRHFLLFKCRQLEHQNSSLMTELMRLNTTYAKEITRLNQVYTEEIARRLEHQNQALKTKVYTEEIAQQLECQNESLDARMAHLNTTYTTEIARLNKVYTEEIARLNETIVDIQKSALRSFRSRMVQAVLSLSPTLNFRRCLAKFRGSEKLPHKT
jgi:hypothetical protein